MRLVARMHSSCRSAARHTPKDGQLAPTLQLEEQQSRKMNRPSLLYQQCLLHHKILIQSPALHPSHCDCSKMLMLISLFKFLV